MRLPLLQYHVPHRAEHQEEVRHRVVECAGDDVCPLVSCIVFWVTFAVGEHHRRPSLPASVVVMSEHLGFHRQPRASPINAAGGAGVGPESPATTSDEGAAAPLRALMPVCRHSARSAERSGDLARRRFGAKRIDVKGIDAWNAC